MDVYDEAELYCAAFDFPVDDEVDWLRRCFPEATSVLEPFCGNARYARTFVDRGMTYLGFDLNPAMLARAPVGAQITVVRADARDFDLGEQRFDLAWCPINSLCHLTDEQNIISHLRCVRRHLAPGGAYVVELELFRHDGPWRDPPDAKNDWTIDQQDGSTVIGFWRRLRCDLSTMTCVERAAPRRERDGHVIAEAVTDYTMRMITCADFTRMVAEAGFAIDDEVVRHRGKRPWEVVALSPAIENDAANFFFTLRA